MFKKIAALVLSLALACASFVSCGSSDSSSTVDSSTADSSAADSASEDDSTAEVVIAEPSLTIDGEKVDTDGLVMLTINGKDIDFDTFRYYYLTLMYNYGYTADTLTEDQFSELLDTTLTTLKQQYVPYYLADDCGITLDDDDTKEIEDSVDELKSSYESEEEYLTTLKQYYLTEDVFKTLSEHDILATKIQEEAFTGDGKYATSADEFKKIVQDTDVYARAIHILIPPYAKIAVPDDYADSYDSMSLSEKLSVKQTAYYALSEEEQAAAKDEAKALAEEVLQKVKDGEDFRTLIDEYGWDPGMEQELYKDGYYITPDSSFIEEFKTATFGLGIDEYTDELVESEDYGYFIIKRLAVDMDYVEENIDSLIVEYDSPRLSELVNDAIEKQEVNLSDTYNKLTYNSIT